MTHNESELEKLIGKRCKTKDIHDFPDTKEDERCLTCTIWEQLDTNYISKQSVKETIVGVFAEPYNYGDYRAKLLKALGLEGR